MEALPLLGICTALLARVFANALPGEGQMVVGLAKCADCAGKNMKAEAAFKGLQVAVKCKNADGVFETKAIGEVDTTGAFAVPLNADLLSEDDGELKQDCFAQLHSATNKPCPGQEPSWIVRPSHGAAKKTFVAVAGKMHYSSKECTSAFLCDPFHKKHLFHKKPIMIPHFHKKPVPVPEYKPPTPVPVYTHPTPMPEYRPPTPVYTHRTPVPEYKPPTPVYTHPTPIYHPPADSKMQNPQTDTQLFKKLPTFHKKPIEIPHFQKKPLVIPHFHKKPKPESESVPVPEHKPSTPVPVYTHPTPVPEYKPPTPVYTHPSPIYHHPGDEKMQNPETDPQLFKKLLPFIKKNPFFSKFPKVPPVKEETTP